MRRGIAIANFPWSNYLKLSISCETIYAEGMKKNRLFLSENKDPGIF